MQQIPAAVVASGSSSGTIPPGCVSVLVEWKYDGQRAQVHVLPGGQVRGSG
jgi:ATP-dependent DNA ligase